MSAVGFYFHISLFSFLATSFVLAVDHLTSSLLVRGIDRAYQTLIYIGNPGRLTRAHSFGFHTRRSLDKCVESTCINHIHRNDWNFTQNKNWRIATSGAAAHHLVKHTA